MASDSLYKLAFEYRETKLWKSLMDNEVFAIKLPDGETGYISIMGMAGDYIAAGIYIGRKGFNSYRIIASTYGYDFKSQLLYQECLLQQECLQCTFQDKVNLSKEEAAEVMDYAEKNNIRLKRGYTYPQFVKYRAGYCPWGIQTEQDWMYIEEMLKAAIALAGMIDGKTLAEINSIGGSGKIPFLEQTDDGYRISSIEMPEPLPEEYTMPGIYNDINVARLKNMEKSGVWECELVQYPEPVRNSPEEVPHFPMMFLAVESNTGFILPVSPVEYFDESSDKLLDIVVEAFLMQNICPKVIHARDKRSYCFLEGLCKKIRTRLVIEPELPSLDGAEEDLLEHIDEGGEENLQDIADVIDRLLDLSIEELKGMPDAITSQFKVLLEKDILPEELSAKVGGMLKLLEDGNGTEKDNVIPMVPASTLKTSRSYVISVSCYKGCYRHIQISENSTLFSLHEAILEAFGFDEEDHAHVFFMDNVKWSDYDSYYIEGIDGYEDRNTGNTYLAEAGFEKGKKFKYLFDFGDCWLFQCSVLKVVDKYTEEPFVIKSVGEAPEQYPDWEI